MRYLIALLFCFSLAAQQTVNNFTVKTNLIVAGQDVAVSVDTVSDLPALNADVDRTVNVLGRTTAGDGGGGVFRRVLASSGTANTGTFFVSTQNPTYAWSRVVTSDPISAIWFGATANDASDDTTALQNWINYLDSTKKEGKIPAGSYRISSTLTVGTVGNFDSSSIIGDGETSIITQYTANTPAIELRGSWLLKNFRLNAATNQTSAQTNSVGVLLYKTHMGVIDGLVVHGFSYGIRKKIENQNYVFSQVIQNCRIEAFSNWGITITREGAVGGESGSVLVNNYINTKDPEYSGSSLNAVGGLKFESVSELTLIQQNVEWANFTDSCYKFIDCNTATIIAPHVEGINFIGTGDVSVFNNFQSKLTISSAVIITTSVTNTASSLSLFYGYGTGATLVSGLYQSGLSNPGSITSRRFNLPNANHTATIVGGSSSVTSDFAPYYAPNPPNFVLDYDKLAYSSSWTTNSFNVSTNLVVASNATVGGVVTVGGTTSYGNVTIDKSTQENNVYIGSFQDSAKAFKVSNNNGQFIVDGSGTNTVEIMFKNKGSIERLRIKPNGQIRFIPLASDPANPENGDVYYNSTVNKLKCYNGTTWNDLF